MIKDRITAWFISNVILPKKEIIHYPGFIAIRISPKNITYSLRQLFLPEDLLSYLEISIDKKKPEGAELLYSVGKNFVFNYARLLKFMTSEEKNFKNFAYYFVRYIECTYAKRIQHKIDFDKKRLDLHMDNYIVCRKNGLGHIFSEGSIAGIWSYAYQDPTIEAVQPKCQGRGDNECLVIAAPYKTLVEMGYKPMRCTKVEELKLDEQHLQFNQIRPAEWATNSLRSLIDSGFFKYSHGQVTYKGERFFLCEASFMYILEKELKL